MFEGKFSLLENIRLSSNQGQNFCIFKLKCCDSSRRLVYQYFVHYLKGNVKYQTSVQASQQALSLSTRFHLVFLLCPKHSNFSSANKNLLDAVLLLMVRSMVLWFLT